MGLSHSRETSSMSVPARKKSNPSPIPVAGMLEDIVGCKWSLRVLRLVSEGVRRPGAMQRQVPGLTAKVLNERLRKLLRFEIIEREVFAEVPPRVEYRLTRFGTRFVSLLEKIEELEKQRRE